MKYLSHLILTFSLLVCSCNKNEPALEINLPISETYVPKSIELDSPNTDDELKLTLIHLVNNNIHIVNNTSELPNDPIGFGEAYNNINFKQSTLLIKYLLHDYTIDTYNSRYYRNTKENTYNWAINIGSASSTGNDFDNTQLTRFSILVNKLPAEANIKSWYGLYSIGWFPSQ